MKTLVAMSSQGSRKQAVKRLKETEQQTKEAARLVRKTGNTEQISQYSVNKKRGDFSTWKEGWKRPLRCWIDLAVLAWSDGFLNKNWIKYLFSLYLYVIFMCIAVFVHTEAMSTVNNQILVCKYHPPLKLIRTLWRKVYFRAGERKHKMILEYLVSELGNI